jgi:hypothetical protein
MVNTYNEHVLVQIRVYSRSFHDPAKLFPTKKGVALKADEWEALCTEMKTLTKKLVE